MWCAHNQPLFPWSHHCSVFPQLSAFLMEGDGEEIGPTDNQRKRRIEWEKGDMWHQPTVHTCVKSTIFTPPPHCVSLEISPFKCLSLYVSTSLVQLASRCMLSIFLLSSSILTFFPHSCRHHLSASFLSHSADPARLFRCVSSLSSRSAAAFLPPALSPLLRFHPSDVIEEKETGSDALIGRGRQHPQPGLTVPSGCGYEVRALSRSRTTCEDMFVFTCVCTHKRAYVSCWSCVWLFCCSGCVPQW